MFPEVAIAVPISFLIFSALASPINKLNFEQIVASTNKKPNQNHFHKCVELDRKLINLYEEALEIDSENEILKYQNERIAKVVEENIHLLESTGFILES